MIHMPLKSVGSHDREGEYNWLHVQQCAMVKFDSHSSLNHERRSRMAKDRISFVGIVFASLLMVGCPSPFTYGITKSTLDAGLREESVARFGNATRKDGRIIMNYFAKVSVPTDEDKGNHNPRRILRGLQSEQWEEERGAVWELEDLRSKVRPTVSITSSHSEMNGEPEPVIEMSSTLFESLEDYQRERLALVERHDLYWIGNGNAKKLSGFDKPPHREFWGYLAQGALPLAVIADVLTHPFQMFSEIATCSMSVSAAYRDPRCK